MFISAGYGMLSGPVAPVLTGLSTHCTEPTLESKMALYTPSEQDRLHLC